MTLSLAARRRSLLLSAALFAAIPLTPSAQSHDYTRTLHAPAKVKGFIGGESHNSYKIHARKAQIMTVRISWKPEHDPDTGDNHAEFFVSKYPDFGNDGTDFGTASDQGRSWSGVVPATGDYYIYVMAHPTAHYTLKVTLR